MRRGRGWGDDGRVPDWWRIGRTPSREKQLEGLGDRQASQVEGRGRVRLPGRHPTGCPAGPEGFLPCPGLWLPLLSPSNDPSQGAAAGRQCRETGPRRARRPWPQAPLAQPQPHLLKEFLFICHCAIAWQKHHMLWLNILPRTLDGKC